MLRKCYYKTILHNHRYPKSDLFSSDLNEMFVDDKVDTVFQLKRQKAKPC